VKWCTIFLELLAHRALESAYFVVARRRKTCLLAPPQHGGRAIPDARSSTSHRRRGARGRRCRAVRVDSPVPTIR
jgi:hypothetical protein